MFYKPLFWHPWLFFSLPLSRFFYQALLQIFYSFCLFFSLFFFSSRIRRALSFSSTPLFRLLFAVNTRGLSVLAWKLLLFFSLGFCLLALARGTSLALGGGGSFFFSFPEGRSRFLFLSCPPGLLLFFRAKKI